MSRKIVVFFRAETKFVAPRYDQFPFNVDLLKTIDIGDNLKSLEISYEKIKTEILAMQEEHIYICGAMSIGHGWLIRGYLEKEFPNKKIHFLQMARDKFASSGEKKYEIWS